MAIRASSARQIDALIADLTSGAAIRRDAAVARLTVIGARAVERLCRLIAAPSAALPAARAAALRALEAIGDERALEPALASIGDDDAAVALAAISAARVFIRGPKGAAVVDRLTAVALDSAGAEPARIAAVRALRGLGAATIAPLLEKLAGDANAAVRAEALPARKAARRRPAPDPLVDLSRALDQGLPDDPRRLRQIVSQAGPSAPLPQLLAVIEQVRDREAVEPLSRRAEWTTTRAAAHLALARRGSRIALFDLRESLEKAAAALPVEMLAAVSLVGDASCLEPIASAHARSSDRWWRDRLLDAFHTIVGRERLTPRHAVMKRIAARWNRGAVPRFPP